MLLLVQIHIFSSTSTLIEQERDEIDDFVFSAVESKNQDYNAKVQSWIPSILVLFCEILIPFWEKQTFLAGKESISEDQKTLFPEKNQQIATNSKKYRCKIKKNITPQNTL